MNGYIIPGTGKLLIAINILVPGIAVRFFLKKNAVPGTTKTCRRDALCLLCAWYKNSHTQRKIYLVPGIYCAHTGFWLW